MGNKCYTRDLTLDEAKEEQKEMQQKIDDLKSQVNPEKGTLKK